MKFNKKENIELKIPREDFEKIEKAARELNYTVNEYIEKVLTRAICNQNKITLTIDSLKALPGLVVANDGKPTLVPSTLLDDEGNILGYVVLD